ncbi:MAG: BAX inhibitor (BI)-1/YccA family protein [Oscillospiraceae bacterium]|nr:MAG: BAX inhibitor (BI)-1/YccA family protein [Oscillospiraceae bacterium]
MFPDDELALKARQDKSPLYRHVAVTYLWMFVGLALTFVTGILLFSSNLVFLFYRIPAVSILLLGAQLGLVIFLSARFTRMSVNGCRAVFIFYSVLTGFVVASVLIAYDAVSVFLAFGSATLFFGCMAAAGLITRRDVSGFGPLVVFGLLALLVMEMVNLFLQADALDSMLSLAGVAIFLGITTYDSKRTKDLYYAHQDNPEMLGKMSIYSALELYLDFMNLFVYLLRLIGKKR